MILSTLPSWGGKNPFQLGCSGDLTPVRCVHVLYNSLQKRVELCACRGGLPARFAPLIPVSMLPCAPLERRQPFNFRRGKGHAQLVLNAIGFSTKNLPGPLYYIGNDRCNLGRRCYLRRPFTVGWLAVNFIRSAQSWAAQTVHSQYNSATGPN